MTDDHAARMLACMDRGWAAAGKPTMRAPGRASASLSLDHREMRLSHGVVRLTVEPGSGAPHPLGGGGLRTVFAALTPSKVLYAIAVYGDGDGTGKMLTISVPLDGGTVGDCAARALRAAPELRDAATAVVRLLVAAETTGRGYGPSPEAGGMLAAIRAAT